MEASGRTLLQFVQYNDNTDTSKISVVKDFTTILRYEILISGTLWDLMDVVCKETCIGDNEEEFADIWNVDSYLDGESGDIPRVWIFTRHFNFL